MKIKYHLVKGNAVKQKLPITALFFLSSILHLNISSDASFCAVCLVTFFGLFRKLHLLPVSASKFILTYSSLKVLLSSTHGVHSFMPNGARPFNSESELIPFLYLSFFTLPCVSPYQGLLFYLCSPHQYPGLCLSWSQSSMGICSYLQSFLSEVRNCLDRLGHASSDYAGYSFCRGMCLLSLSRC